MTDRLTPNIWDSGKLSFTRRSSLTKIQKKYVLIAICKIQTNKPMVKRRERRLVRVWSNVHEKLRTNNESETSLDAKKSLSCKILQDSGRILQDDASSCKNFFQNLARSYKITLPPKKQKHRKTQKNGHHVHKKRKHRKTQKPDNMWPKKKKHRKAQKKSESFSPFHAKSFQSHFRVEKTRKIEAVIKSKI